MGIGYGVPPGADRVIADVLRTTGSVLRLRDGDARDFKRLAPPGDRVEYIIAIGSVVGPVLDPPDVPTTDEPQPVVRVELDGEDLEVFGLRWNPADPEEALAELVDHLQDILDKEIWGGWPFCPHHSAHLDPGVRDGFAVWLCPRGEIVARVGDLPRHEPKG